MAVDTKIQSPGWRACQAVRKAERSHKSAGRKATATRFAYAKTTHTNLSPSFSPRRRPADVPRPSFVRHAMSLPGLSLSAPAEVAAPAAAPVAAAPNVQDLQAQSEWRFEVPYGSRVEVKLLSGTAEIFGTELAPQQIYTFSGTKAAIYSWAGCRLETTGQCQVEYTAEETPMATYANVHFALEDLRQQAVLNGKEGPRVLVVGPDNAGKTSLVKLLTGYATRAGRQPMVVNLDSREGVLSIPGSLTAAVFSSMMDVEEGWGSSPTSGPRPVPVKLPLVYYYGLPSSEDNPKLFKPVVSRLALTATSRLVDDVETKGSGCIIDTPGIISQGKNGYDIVQHIVSEFSVNVLLVLGSERLYSDMLRRFDKRQTGLDEPMSVVKLPKSGGCVDRDETYMKQMRQGSIREYFFGDSKGTLSPHTQLVDFSQLNIFKVIEDSDMMTSLLPGGEEDEGTNLSSLIFDKVEPSTIMQNCVLSIMHAEPTDSAEVIRDASVMGFVYVADVDEKKRKLRLLTPVSGRVPNKPLVWGTWPESITDLVG